MSLKSLPLTIGASMSFNKKNNCSQTCDSAGRKISIIHFQENIYNHSIKNEFSLSTQLNTEEHALNKHLLRSMAFVQFY